jgi:pimeloyl-ACP methyl ester carboxylesterase
MRLQGYCCRLISLLIIAFTTTFAADLYAAPTVAFSQSAPQRTIGTTPPVSEASWVSVRGKSPFDRIGLHRLAAATAPSGPLVLYLPGTNMNGELPLTDPRHWLPLYLAVNGADVWSLDYRTHFVPPQTPIERLTQMRDWTDAMFISDIDAAIDFILATTGHSRLFLAGFSRGAAFAYLYAAEHPEKVAGLVILDGFILRPGGFGGLNTGAPRAVATDIGGRSLTYDKRKALMELVIRDPNAPAPISKYRTARDNLEHVVYESKAFGGHGGLANPAGGYSDAAVLARVLITYDRYWPAVQDSENPLTPALSQSLARSKIPVLAFASTNIAPQWPSMVKAGASETGAKPTVVVLSGWGHLDVLCGNHAADRVYAPTLEWLRQHAAEASAR